MLFAFLRRLLTVAYLMTHPAVPLRLRLLPVAALFYFLFPRDGLFDFRALGLLDDVVVALFLLGVFTSKGWGYVLRAQKRKNQTIRADFEVLNQRDQGEEGIGQDATDAKNQEAPPTDLRF